MRRRFVRWTLPLLVLAANACAFDPAGLGPRDGALASADAATADAAPPGDGAPPVVDAGAADAAGPVVCPKDTTLLGCYRFEEQRERAQPFDESNYRNHGISSGVSFPPGRGGQVLELGTTSEVRVPDSMSLTPRSQITLELWVNAFVLPMTGRMGLIDNDGQYGLFLEPGGVVRCSLGVINFTAPAGAVVVDQWRHVACTFDGVRATIYVNGTVAVTAAAGGTLGMGNSIGLAIGHNAPMGDQLLGRIDDLRIWGVARTATQICYAAGRTDC